MSAARITIHADDTPTPDVRVVGGRFYAGLTTGTPGLPGWTQVGVVGTPETVVRILTDLARAATDAAVLAVNNQPDREGHYTPSGPVADGIEVSTSRQACCGAGPDRTDIRTGERLHLPGCPQVASAGLAACRTALTSSPAVVCRYCHRAIRWDFGTGGYLHAANNRSLCLDANGSRHWATPDRTNAA